MKSIISLFVALYALIASVCAAPQLFVSEYENDGKALTQSSRQGTIVDKLREDKRFSRFVEVLEQERGLRDDLENREKQTTLFAPTNEAFKHMEDQWRNSKDEEKPSMRDVLRYHIAPDSQISGDCLHAGALIPTNLRLKSLEDRHQRIRVFRFHGEVWLNMHARVVQKDLEAENGLIHAIDRCLMPPMTIGEMLYTMPTRFSTSLAAFERTGLQEVCTKKGITVFAPTNRAWETLGFDNLRYLFSCMGQQKPSEGRSIFGGEEHPQCEGTKMLKKILKYHIATKLAYSTDLMEKETTRLGTMEGKNLEVCAVRTEGHKGRDEKKHHDVRNYNFVINKGQARIAFSDGLGSNGAVQVIDSVLIPDDVKLPHDRWMA